MATASAGRYVCPSKKDWDMALRNSSESYGSVAKAMHWVVAALMLTAWVLGTFGDDLPQGSARSAGLFVHISAGLAILGLMLVRLLWRIGNPPPLPEHTIFGRWAERAGVMMHYVLYALVLAVIILGIAVQFARGNALPVFAWFEIASPWSPDRAFARSLKEIHEVLANGLMILVGLHTAAALFHHWVLRDRTLLRMLPWRVR